MGDKSDSDDTVTSLDENTENFCSNSARDVLAEGILHLFKPSVERLEESIQEIRASQTELKTQLDAITIQLHIIEKAQSNIPEFSLKVKELINIKHKVTVITNILASSQERLTGLFKLIEREEQKRQTLLESTLNSSIS